MDNLLNGNASTIDAFRRFGLENGYNLPADTHFTPRGNFPHFNKQTGRTADADCSYCLSESGHGCIFDFPADTKISFRSSSARELSQDELESYRANIQEASERFLKEKKACSIRAAEIYNGFKKLQAPTDYMIRKRVSFIAHGMKSDNQGNLVFPLYNKNLQVVNFQTVYNDGAKRPSKGAILSETFFPIFSKKAGDYENYGILDIAHDESVFLAEGIATALSIYEAFDGERTVICCLSCGNLAKVARLFPRAVIIADNDAKPGTDDNPGLDHARMTGNRFILIDKMGDPAVSDANDYAMKFGGVKALRNFIENATVQSGTDSFVTEKTIQEFKEICSRILPRTQNSQGYASALARFSKGELIYCDGMGFGSFVNNSYFKFQRGSNLPAMDKCQALASYSLEAGARFKKIFLGKIKELGIESCKFLDAIDEAKKSKKSRASGEDVLNALGKKFNLAPTNEKAFCTYCDYYLLAEKLERAGEAEGDSIKKRGVLEELKTASFLGTEINSLDQKGTLLNTPSGVIDLTKGLSSVRKATTADRFTNCTATGLKETQEGRNLFYEQLSKICLDDEHMMRFLQLVFGYCLYGKNAPFEKNKFFFLIGSGANGKGTLVELWKNTVGPDFCGGLNGKFLVRHEMDLGAKRFATGPAVFGKRAVLIDEIPPNAILDEAEIKTLAGGSSYPVEFKGRDTNSEYQNYATPIWAINDLPNVTNWDPAMLRRIVAVTFPAKFWRSASDPNYSGDERFRADDTVKPRMTALCRESMLLWAIEGARILAENGGAIEKFMPPAILQASEKWKKDTDTVGNFCDTVLRKSENIPYTSWPATSTVFRTYKKWCDANGYPALKLHQFRNKMRDKGYEISTIDGGDKYKNSALLVTDF